MERSNSPAKAVTITAEAHRHRHTVAPEDLAEAVNLAPMQRSYSPSEAVTTSQIITADTVTR